MNKMLCSVLENLKKYALVLHIKTWFIYTVYNIQYDLYIILLSTVIGNFLTEYRDQQLLKLITLSVSRAKYVYLLDTFK